MRLNSTIPDAERRAIIAPEVEALFGDEYYSTLLANAQGLKLNETGRFLIPVASFLVRAARRVLVRAEQAGTAPVQIEDRTAAGIREVRHISRVCMEDNVFSHYRKAEDFGELTIRTDKSPTRLSSFGQAIFRDVGWVAGGVVHVMQAQGYDSIAATATLIHSTKLQRIGWISEEAIEETRLYLGMPYIKPEYIQLHSKADTAAPIATFTPSAMQHIQVARGQMGCPARRILAPDGQGTAFGAEWNDMVKHLVPPAARADGAIGAVMDAAP